METSTLKLGVEVRGIRLTEKVLSNEQVDALKRLVQEHRIVVFRDQGKVSGEKHVEISKYFGTIDRTLHEGDTIFPHPKCHNADVYRISNDPEEGCTNVGRSGWHIDGGFMPEPFCYVIYHMLEVPKTGPTGNNLVFHQLSLVRCVGRY
jgi:alpha-ketoglutarate-dependent taurine dioxygenase